MEGRRDFVLLNVAFFASGFAALIYQIVWQRMLGMFAGSDAVTAALAVGAFLLGIGIGSLAAGAFADRLRPRAALWTFAACEAGIAAFALLSKTFFYDFVVVDLGPHIESAPAIFAVCFAGLLLPTFLMGVSLPVLSRAVVQSLAGAASRIGWLYGANTIGAAIGCFAAGWVLIGELGYEGALWVGVACNLFAGLLALAARGESGAVAADDTQNAPQRVTATNDTFGFPVWCALVFVSGFIIVALEIIWVRALGVLAQNSAYSFATILGIFLIADGAGLAVGARWVRRDRDLRSAFFALQGIAALYAAVSFLLLYAWADAEWFTRHLSPDVSRLRGDNLIAVFALAALAVAPPSFLLGMSFPLVQKVVQTDLAAVGRKVALVQVANIVGNGAGSLGAGLLALDLLGTAGSLIAIAALALAMILWGMAAGRYRRPTLWRHGVLCVALVGAAVVFPHNNEFWAKLHVTRPGQTALVSEDRSGVSVLRIAPERSPLFIGGHAQSQVPFLPIHAFLGSVGPLVHPSPREVLVVGVGTGGTPYAAGVRAESSVRAIELVRPVYRVMEQYAASRPESPVARMFADARYTFVEGDGRREIFKSGRKYDVIQIDAILPETSHSGMLYSRAFMELAKAALHDDGIFVQWTPTLRVLDTVAATFPHVVHLRPASIALASKQPLPFDADRLQAALERPEVQRHLAGTDPAALRRAFAGPNPSWRPDRPRTVGPLNEDLYPRDEYYLNNRLRGATD